MTSNSPELGIHLLETITKGLYADPLHCIREYVQNSFDSIRDARRQGILSEDEGEIQITLFEDEGTITVRDNGTGLSPAEAEEKLLSLGMSRKAVESDGKGEFAGFRGIGRVAGITHCKRLRFTTSTGDGTLFRVEYNAEKINKMTTKGVEPTTIANAMQANCVVATESIAENVRFFEVSMIEIDETGKECLDAMKLRDYLSQVAPVAYAPSSWPSDLASKIVSIAKESNALSSLSRVKILIKQGDSVQINVQRNLRKSFKVSGKGKSQREVSITDIKKLPSNHYGSGKWWGWLAIHEREGQLKDVSFSGIRIRAQNIEVGGSEIVKQLFKSQNLADWCVGEIHIVGADITPNAGRDNFEDSAGWSLVRQEIQQEVEEIEKKIRWESANRNKSVAAMRAKARKAIDRTEQQLKDGVVSHNHKEKMIRDLEKTKSAIEDAAKSKSRDFREKSELAEVARELDSIIWRVRSVEKTNTDNALQHLDKKTKRVVHVVQQVLKEEISDEQLLRRIEEKINERLQPGRKA